MKPETFDELRFHVAARTATRWDARATVSKEGSDCASDSIADGSGLLTRPQAADVEDRLIEEGYAERIEPAEFIGEKHGKGQARYDTPGYLFPQPHPTTELTDAGVERRNRLLRRFMAAVGTGDGLNAHLPTRRGENDYRALFPFIKKPAPSGLEKCEPLELTEAQMQGVGKWCLPECRFRYMTDAELWGAENEGEPAPKWILRAAYLATEFCRLGWITPPELQERARTGWSQRTVRDTVEKMAENGMLETRKGENGKPGPNPTEYGFSPGSEAAARLENLVRRGAATVIAHLGDFKIPTFFVDNSYCYNTQKLRGDPYPRDGEFSTLNEQYRRSAETPNVLDLPLRDPAQVALLCGQSDVEDLEGGLPARNEGEKG